MNTVKVKYNDDIHEYESGTTLLEISKHFQKEFMYDIIVGQVDGDLCELDYRVNKDCELRFYDLTHHFGNKVYERGLVFIFVSAIKEILNCDVRISHSIDKGIFCEPLKEVTENDITDIKNKMMEYANQKIPFVKVNTSKMSAIDYYEGIKRLDKTEALRYEIRNSILLYKFKDIYEYFFGEMPLDSSYIKYFDIYYIDSKSLVLLLPSTYENGRVKPYEHHDKIFSAFRSFSDWCKCQGITNVYELNKTISSGQIGKLIYMNESHSNRKLFETATNIFDNKSKIVLIGGPSSSGKTTTAKKLNSFLMCIGLKPHTLSIDDYFLEKGETPKDEEGHYDFESVRAVDTKLFNNHLKRLLNGEEVLTPTYNFIAGKKEYKKKLKLEKNGILVIEGLHALNDELTSSIDKDTKYKIYISPLTSLNIDNHNRITTSDLRIIRRMVRDNMNRGYDASDRKSVV